ncbi:hypothetical protein K7432_011465 [Basidiobolus ranarum]|uniref:Uncharacterized protein n=1 Tax=Basidiobolus ranarum TaxID=34480 RepID=A0ABR2WM95_9FUNG
MIIPSKRSSATSNHSSTLFNNSSCVLSDAVSKPGFAITSSRRVFSNSFDLASTSTLWR